MAAQLRAYQRGEALGLTPQLLITGLAVVLILVGSTILPLRLGARRIETMEITSGGVE